MKFYILSIFILFYIIMIISKFYLYSEKYILSCIVVRTNNPTKSQISRYQEWKIYFPNSFHFYIISMKFINLSSLQKTNIYNIVVPFNEVILNYPNITALKGNCSNFKNQRLLSWISHSESLTIFYKKVKLKYDFVWIIEQDVGFLGNLYKFISLYKNNVKDLITIGVGKISPKWVWYNCATSKYINRRTIFFNNSYGFANREYVQRWSKIYFYNMKMDLKNNYHSQSETSSFELVLYHNLTYETIPKKFIGSPLHAGKSITKSKWFNMSKNVLNHNKFFHPLKF